MAKPIMGGNDDDVVMGTDGADTIQSKGGDDIIRGGKGNDDIDGGTGVDTAVYSGSYSQYVVTFKGTGNDKVTVADSVANRDGTDQLKQVEWLKFNDATVNVQSGEVSQWHYSVNATLDPAAQDPSQSPGNMYVGTGIPADNFGIARNEDAGIELGLKVHNRTGDPAVPSTDTYADGVLHFQVHQGSQPGNPARAAWNFDWSVATGLNGETTGLSDFTIKLLVDVDRTANTSYHELTLSAVGANTADVHWTDQYGNILIVDDEGVANKVAQNSQNFAFAIGDTNPGTPGTQTYDGTNWGPGNFDIILEAFNGTQLVGINHIVVDVV
jgi:hypothetical protein